jgi:hypothetical protein
MQYANRFWKVGGGDVTNDYFNGEFSISMILKDHNSVNDSSVVNVLAYNLGDVEHYPAPAVSRVSDGWEVVLDQTTYYYVWEVNGVRENLNKYINPADLTFPVQYMRVADNVGYRVTPGLESKDHNEYFNELPADVSSFGWAVSDISTGALVGIDNNLTVYTIESGARVGKGSVNGWSFFDTTQTTRWISYGTAGSTGFRRYESGSVIGDPTVDYKGQTLVEWLNSEASSSVQAVVEWSALDESLPQNVNIVSSDVLYGALLQLSVFISSSSANSVQLRILNSNGSTSDVGAGFNSANSMWTATIPPPIADMKYLWIVDGVQENLINLAAAGELAQNIDSGRLITDGNSYAKRVWKVGDGDVANDQYNGADIVDELTLTLTINDNMNLSDNMAVFLKYPDPHGTNIWATKNPSDSKKWTVTFDPAPVSNMTYYWGVTDYLGAKIEENYENYVEYYDQISTRTWQKGSGNVNDTFSPANLIAGGEFSSSVWYGNGYNRYGGNSQTVDVQDAGNPWDTNLSGTVALLPGAAYTLTFDVQSNFNRTISAGIGRKVAPLQIPIQLLCI